MGRIDILINIAGIIRHHPIMEMSYEDWNAVLRVNLTGYFHTCKNAVPHMKAQRYGRIVNIASIGGRTGRPGCGCNYFASSYHGANESFALLKPSPSYDTLKARKKGGRYVQDFFGGGR